MHTLYGPGEVYKKSNLKSDCNFLRQQKVSCSKTINKTFNNPCIHVSFSDCNDHCAACEFENKDNCTACGDGYSLIGEKCCNNNCSDCDLDDADVNKCTECPDGKTGNTCTEGVYIIKTISTLQHLYQMGPYYNTQVIGGKIHTHQKLYICIPNI